MSFRYQKKPVFVEAVQYYADMGTYTVAVPYWLITTITKGIIFERDGKTWMMSTQGEKLVLDEDYIVRGEVGELFPMSKKEFEEKYIKA